MFKRPFFNLGAKPKLRYALLESDEARTLKDIPLPEKALLFLPGRALLAKKAGDKMRTGERVGSVEGGSHVLVSTVTGEIAAVSYGKGLYERVFTAITVNLDGADAWDEELLRFCRRANLEELTPYLTSMPGRPAFASLPRSDPSAHTVIIPALDKDILTSTTPFLLRTRMDDLRGGIEHLKKLTSARIVLAVPPGLDSLTDRIGADIHTIEPLYPNAHPKLLARAVLGRSSPEEQVQFLSVESVVGLNGILERGEFPFDKFFTVIGKDLRPVHVRARIGTPVGDVVRALNIQIEQGDRVILGGPMAGEVVFEENAPVLADTDGLVVQGKDRIQECSDTHCINCGECVRVCPSGIQVNMLIRFLENGIYQEAADLYRLMDCIDCGLCGYVCTARTPLFQYIMLGKHELARKKALEVAIG